MVSAASPITPQRSEPNSALSVVAERVLTKNAWRLLPLLAFASFVHYMDRTNIAFAALSMNRDLGLTAAEFGTAASIFYLGYVLVCIPTRHARSGCKGRTAEAARGALRPRPHVGLRCRACLGCTSGTKRSQQPLACALPARAESRVVRLPVGREDDGVQGRRPSGRALRSSRHEGARRRSPGPCSRCKPTLIGKGRPRSSCRENQRQHDDEAR